MSFYTIFFWLMCVIVVYSKVHSKSIPTGKLYGVKDAAKNPSNHDRVRRYAFNAYNRWNKTSISYREQVGLLVEKAFAEWAPHCGLQFTRVDSGHADIMLSFQRSEHGDRINFDEVQVLAHADIPSETGSVVHFNDDAIWVAQGEGSVYLTEFYQIALHQIGRALGLNVSNVEDSIMFEYENPNVLSLTADDITGMRKLYGLSDDFISANTNNELSTTTETILSTTTETEYLMTERLPTGYTTSGATSSTRKLSIVINTVSLFAAVCLCEVFA